MPGRYQLTLPLPVFSLLSSVFILSPSFIYLLFYIPASQLHILSPFPPYTLGSEGITDRSQLELG